VKESSLDNSILSLLVKHESLKSSEIATNLDYSQRQILRSLGQLIKDEKIRKLNSGKNSVYQATTFGRLLYVPQIEDLSEERLETTNQIKFNFDIFEAFRWDLLGYIQTEDVQQCVQDYQHKITDIPPVIWQKEVQRLIVEFAWKSSQIEGNTFSLLETEALISNQENTGGHSREESQMIINHKNALETQMAKLTHAL
jgi:hypothetical protein